MTPTEKTAPFAAGRHAYLRDAVVAGSSSKSGIPWSLVRSFTSVVSHVMLREFGFQLSAIGYQGGS
jgi:hypothetical protein